MAKLIYIANTSLDGYIEDPEGRFDWTDPDEEVFIFITDFLRQVGTHLYGRRLYETMMVWETDPKFAAESPANHDFAETWQAANKIVFSRTWKTVSTQKTQLKQNFDPDEINQLKEDLDKDLFIGGAELAAQAFRSDLIDEIHLFILPVILGGGKQCLPDEVRSNLDLLDERRFDSGTVYLRYRTKQLS